ncbi:MAG: 1-acyl-sn-glycerol-3-phosphate acyltransferase, partial [Desulfobacteraceae bacterium]|nr:1-acyl-sn-glycerol-3-phosphate acyltransferase [Desulfobacteraceae bacterium]
MRHPLPNLIQSLQRPLLRVLFSWRYTLTVSGLSHLPKEGGLMLLGNHVSWIDWAVLSLAVPRRVRFVMDKGIYERWYLNWLLRWVGIIPVSPRAIR